jgi:hypothetical protein
MNKSSLIIRKLEDGETVTVGSKDDPHASYALGHISAKEFSKRHKKEGWEGGFEENHLEHCYMVVNKNSIRKSTVDNHRALAATLFVW